jgi:phenylacetate-CoA ligase
MSYEAVTGDQVSGSHEELGAASIDDARLQDALSHARRSAFYAERVPPPGGSARERLARVPLTRRRDLMSAPPLARLAGPREDLWQYVESSGTTGTGALAAAYTRDDMARSVAGLTPSFLDLFTRGHTVLNRFPYALAAVSSTLEWLAREGGACIIPASNLSWLVPFPRALDLLRRAAPDVVAALPLEFVILSTLADHLGIPRHDIHQPVEAIIAGGGPLPPALARMIEADWGARIVELYGSTETLALGTGCGAGRLHLATHNFVVEVLDPRTWAPVPAGAPGALALTSLHLRGMPLVRYVNEDIAVVERGLCPCGSALPAARILGRLGEDITMDGRTLYPTDILDAAYGFAEAHGSRILLVIVRETSIHVRVEMPPHRSREEAPLAALRDQLGVAVTVELVRPGDVLDCDSLLKTPMVYKPTPIVDWRGSARRPYTMLDALIAFPRYTFADLRRLVGRALRNYRGKRRL